MFWWSDVVATAEQMAHIDKVTAEEFGVSTSVLMNNAGRAVAQAVAQLIASSGGCADKRLVSGGKIAVLCGPGNNGGDGYCVARTLSTWGYDVTCFSDAVPERYSEAARAELNAWRLSGGQVLPLTELESRLDSVDVAVDALFGTGLQRAIKGACAQAISSLNAHSCRVVAVDVPSGVHCDTGAVLGVAPHCQLTVTMGLGKPGLYLPPGREYAGEVQVAEVGFAVQLVKDETISGRLLSDEAVRALWNPPSPTDHKGSRGCALVLGGCAEYYGAPLLASEAVLRAGAGLCIWGAPAALVSSRPWNYRELVLWPLPAAHGCLSLECWKELEGGLIAQEGGVSGRKLPRIKAVCLGPGLGLHGESAEFVARIVSEIKLPAVIDADALRMLPRRRLSEKVVLTPHVGEMAALLDVSVTAVENDLLGAARQAAERYGATIVLKGVPTIIYQGSRYWISNRSVPVLAQGGTGDVLAGSIASLLAQGYDTASAACLGVAVHAEAGRICAEQIGPQGVLAGEVAARIPTAFGRLLHAP